MKWCIPWRYWSNPGRRVVALQSENQVIQHSVSANAKESTTNRDSESTAVAMDTLDVDKRCKDKAKDMRQIY